MLDFRSMAISLISKNPSIANNPQAQNLISVIQNGDSKKGEDVIAVLERETTRLLGAIRIRETLVWVIPPIHILV